MNGSEESAKAMPPAYENTLATNRRGGLLWITLVYVALDANRPLPASDHAASSPGTAQPFSHDKAYGAR
jgi:hypothetical protein